jgi:hypothetical protein
MEEADDPKHAQIKDGNEKEDLIAGLGTHLTKNGRQTEEIEKLQIEIN